VDRQQKRPFTQWGERQDPGTSVNFMDKETYIKTGTQIKRSPEDLSGIATMRIEYAAIEKITTLGPTAQVARVR